MGWGIIINNVYFNRVHVSEIPEIIEEADASIMSHKEKFLMLAASTPRTVETADGDKIEWNDHVQREISDAMEDLEEQIIRRYLARVCKDSDPKDLIED
jgi:hypothetical protein